MPHYKCNECKDTGQRLYVKCYTKLSPKPIQIDFNAVDLTGLIVNVISKQVVRCESCRKII